MSAAIAVAFVAAVVVWLLLWLLLWWVQERERAEDVEVCSSLLPLVAGDVAAVRDAIAQRGGLEEDVVAAVADAETVVASETAACLEVADVGRQGSRGETPEGC